MNDEKKVMMTGPNTSKETPKTTPKKTVKLKKLTSTTFFVGGKKYCVCVKSDNFTAFLVDGEIVKDLMPGAEVEVNKEDAVAIYSWENELEQLYPDIDTVRQNAFLSFVRSGAFSPEIVKDNKKIRSQVFQTAYPYFEKFKNLLGE